MRGQSRDYPTFPEIEAELGYNPARFLDSAIERTECTEDRTITALIRGIQEVDTIRAWIEVEVDLGRSDGGPRREIIKQLNQRQLTLQEATTDEPAESTKTSDPDELAEPSQPSELDTAPTTASAEEPFPDSTRTACGEDLIPEELAGQLGYWCPTCRDFHEPKETPSTGATQESRALADGGEETTPRCPDCHGEPPTETVGDDEAAWCGYCGGLKPLGGSA